MICLEKRLLAYGIILFLVGILISDASIPNPNSLFSTSTGKLSIPPNGILYLPVKANSTALISYLASNPVDFYLVNRSVLNVVEAYNDSSRIGNVISGLEGRGVIAIIHNNTRGIFPYQGNYSLGYPKPDYVVAYIQNSTMQPIYPNATYYAVYGNEAGNYTEIDYSFVTISPKVSSVNSNSIYGLSTGEAVAGSLAFLTGVILIVFSIVKRNPEYAKAKDGEIARLYDRIQKNEEKKRSAKDKKP